MALKKREKMKKYRADETYEEKAARDSKKSSTG